LLGPWAAGVALAVAAGAGGRFALHRLARGVHPAWSAGLPRALLWLAWGLGVAAWLLGELHAGHGDGRLLLWLALTPLWLGAAGLWGGRRRSSSARRGAAERLPQQGLHGGVMNQIDEIGRA